MRGPTLRPVGTRTLDDVRDRVSETNRVVLALLALAEQLQEVITTYGDRNVIEAARRRGLIPPD